MSRGTSQQVTAPARQAGLAGSVTPVPHREPEWEYYETTVQAGGVEPDPYDAPMPPGEGWTLGERLTMGSLLVFRWKRLKKK